jgi:hypothetical protein
VLTNRISIVPALVVVVLAVASCGGGASSGSSSSTPTGASGQRPARPQLTASQTSCLKQQGVTPPGQGNGGRPFGGNGAPGGGQLTDQQRQQLQQRRQKMLAAFQKCGIQAPQFGGGNGQGAPQPQNGGSSQ